MQNVFAILWTEACQAPLSLGLPRQDYWIGWRFPSPGDLPNPGIDPESLVSPAWRGDSLPLSHQGNLVSRGANSSSSVIPSGRQWGRGGGMSSLTEDSQRIILGNDIESTRIFRNSIIFMTNAQILKINKIVPQFSSVAHLCLTLCDPMNRSTPGLPVHHQLQEFTQTHVYRVSDAIQPSHPRLSPSPPAPNPSQHQSLF